MSPISDDEGFYTHGFTKSYLHHLFKSDEMFASTLEIANKIEDYDIKSGLSLLPVQYKDPDRQLAELAFAGLEEKRIVLIGVNRKKESWGDLTKTFNIINVPTLIVFRAGKEIGRVVEYGKYGQFDRELGEIIQESFNRPR